MSLHVAGTATPSAHAEIDVLRRTLDESFATLAHVLAASEAPTSAQALATVDACRALLASGTNAEAVASQARASFEAIRALATEARHRAAEQRTQITALVTMVRETVTTIAGDHASLHASLAGSAERFERLTQVRDVHLLQRQLFEEVETLKRISVERRNAWEQTYREFGTRLTTLETQLDHTRREASLDPLTNVANRRSFERTCSEWLRPNGRSFVLAMVDVDDFKAINDRHGHAVGDRVLVTVAQMLVRSLRSEDLVARLGGDELAVLAVNLTLAQAEGRFTTIARAVQAACREIVPDGPAPSISLGLAECSAGDTLESLQQRADEALYHAKRSGKGRVATKASQLLRDLRQERKGAVR